MTNAGAGPGGSVPSDARGDPSPRLSHRSPTTQLPEFTQGVRDRNDRELDTTHASVNEDRRRSPLARRLLVDGYDPSEVKSQEKRGHHENKHIISSGHGFGGQRRSPPKCGAIVSIGK